MKRTPAQAISRTLLDEIAPTGARKSQLRRLEILEAAIRHYARDGLEKTTFEKIAKTCKTSRTLIQHYFPDREELFVQAMRYVRARYQEYAISAIERENDPKARLEAYVDASLSWTRESPDFAKVWLLFLYRCGIDRKSREIHSELVRMGQDRITALIEDGNRDKAFKCPRPAETAGMIQVLITGAYVTSLTEDSKNGPDTIHERTRKLVLQWVLDSAT